MVLNHYLPEEKRLSPDIVANLLAKVVHRTFEGLAPDRGEAGESRQIFHELFDQARASSHKKVGRQQQFPSRSREEWKLFPHIYANKEPRKKDDV